MDRNVLLIYLDDLRNMETIVNTSQERKYKVNNKVEKTKGLTQDFINNKPIEPISPKEPNKDITEDNQSSGGGCGSAFLVGMIILGVIFIISGAALGDTFSLACGIFVIVCMGIAFLCFRRVAKQDVYEKERKNWDIINKYKEDYKKYKRDLTAYDRILLNYNNTIQKNKEELDKMYSETVSIVIDLDKDISHYKNKLIEAYSINIIPLQFRNIQGIYYLHDYLSTSQQTLSDALMQCNLESIKSKMDNLISINSSMVIQQAMTNAKLDTVVKQNQEIIELAQRTLNNTATAANAAALTAQYAKISAMNSQANLELQQRQLSYQKADFWLNS